MGVVGAIVPWNWPFHNIINPISAAVFAGNAIVIKVRGEHPAQGSRRAAPSRSGTWDVLIDCVFTLGSGCCWKLSDNPNQNKLAERDLHGACVHLCALASYQCQQWVLTSRTVLLAGV